MPSLHLPPKTQQEKDERCFTSQLLLFISSYQMLEVEVEVEGEVPEATRVEKMGLAQSL